MSVLDSVIGWIAPPQCISCGREGSTLCLGCSISEIVPYGEQCWLCNARSLGGRTCAKCRAGGSPRFVWVTTNYSGAAKELVKIYKFGHQRAAANSLSDLMLQTLFDFNDERSVTKLDYLIVPIPTATTRVRQRGFGHSELLARVLSHKIALQNAPALGRLGQTRQLGSKRSDRLKQPEGNYFIRLPRIIEGRNILLVDDVVTTGATIREATRVLRKAGAKRIDALIFAKRL